MDLLPIPDPGSLRTPDELAQSLRALRGWAGNPSYAELVRRIGAVRAARGVPASERMPGRVTVYDCFRTGRRRIDMNLALDIVTALGVEGPAREQWRRAVRAMLGRPDSDGGGRVSTELPVPVEPFAGRSAELRAVAGPDPRPLVITGMPGVGKTQFAVRAARSLAAAGLGAHGRLFVDLHGYHPCLPPAEPAAVLAGLLVALGQPAERVHRMSARARAARYRELLAERDVLVVLDDAADDDQLRHLLPGTSRGATLVTARNALVGGAGARRIELQPLSCAEVAELFGQVVGADRVRAEPEAVAELGRLCGNLPLDLAVSAARIAATPAWSLADQARRLAARPRGAAAGPALAASYRRLTPADRRLFRLLALHPGSRADAACAGALAGRPAAQAAESLVRLSHEHLIRPVGDDMYEFPCSNREFALHLTVEEDPYSVQLIALEGLLEHYSTTAAAAVAALSGPARAGRHPAVGPRFPDADSAIGWLEREWASAVAVAARAAEIGRTEHACALSRSLGRYLRDTDRGDVAETLQCHARTPRTPTGPAEGPSRRALVPERPVRDAEPARRHGAALEPT
ncbi:NB-ARC domain-containing protein [Streptomyces sp. Tu 6176]|uniref:NB-ARC domain-containing protein n=1 Tax=Streptomyces sp. Tu 6176 TaxID=1470557 RepID=UPI000995F50A|nr:NB-ARC domain-containing protein [Streptomyces sp. Tu 6176]